MSVATTSSTVPTEASPEPLKYQLEQLYEDQEPDLVIDTIAAVLAWVPGKTNKRWQQPYIFKVHHQPEAGSAESEVEIALTWDTQALATHDSNVETIATRMRTGRTALHEDVAKLAAYGLAMVAISVLMPGTRVEAFNRYSAPDLLIDVTPENLRGVEVAGRSTGGKYALTSVMHGSDETPGKHAQLLARTDVAEAHLSLWCASPRVALFSKVKP